MFPAVWSKMGNCYHFRAVRNNQRKITTTKENNLWTAKRYTQEEKTSGDGGTVHSSILLVSLLTIGCGKEIRNVIKMQKTKMVVVPEQVKTIAYLKCCQSVRILKNKKKKKMFQVSYKNSNNVEKWRSFSHECSLEANCTKF